MKREKGEVEVPCRERKEPWAGREWRERGADAVQLCVLEEREVEGIHDQWPLFSAGSRTKGWRRGAKVWHGNLRVEQRVLTRHISKNHPFLALV